MSEEVFDYEKLGQFYLGKEYDLEKSEVTGEPVMYDSKDLVTHGVVLGMTGSGKTGLCIALLEEAAMDNIPAIVIDPKGDISNLMLTFPELDGPSFRPWVNEDDAAKKGLGADEFAEKTAAMWKKGLGDWGQPPERITALRGKVDINIFTPGSNAGIPVSILSSLDVPPPEVMEDGELYGDRVSSTVESLLSLVGVDAEGTQGVEAVLLGAIFQEEWKEGRGLDLEKLIHRIQRPGFGKIGVIDLETFYPEKSRQALAMKFNSLLASPGFSTWLEGAPLDIAKMLHRDDGKPRISIFSIAHLSDKERMFFVSLLLNQMLGWMRTQRGTTSLRALLYMDEIYGFLPPTANPPSKRPMMTMLKQARAFGLGCLLATQNPVDLDYKALSNIGTWFLGRLQTERDKLRVLDGLEGAAGSQNAKFDRKQMETLLSGLGNRVFLMNNVHKDGPVLFHVRWVMSYLTGPLTRGQIKGLMNPKRGDFETQKPVSEDENPMARKAAVEVSSRPAVGAGVIELFAPVENEAYRPFLLREATIHFSLTKAAVEGSRKVAKVNAILEKEIKWDDAAVIDPTTLSEDAVEGVGFSNLPGYAMNANNYKAVKKDFADELYREEREEIWFCPALKAWGGIGEGDADFRVRIAHDAREQRDAAMAKIREDAEKKIRTVEGRLRTAESQLSKEEAEAGSAKVQAGISVLGGILKTIFGRKAGMGGMIRGTSTGAVTKATTAYKQQKDVSNAKAKIEGIEEEIEQLRKGLEKELAEVGESYDPSLLALEKELLKPTRTDVVVERVGLVWR